MPLLAYRRGASRIAERDAFLPVSRAEMEASLVGIDSLREVPRPCSEKRNAAGRVVRIRFSIRNDERIVCLGRQGNVARMTFYETS